MPTRALPLPEFIVLMAMTVASVAFSIDAMLPAMTRIGADLSPLAPNRAQLIITSFVLGMGIATLFTGPLADRFGRKPVILVGFGIYMIGAALAWAAPTLELMLAARVLQGLGAGGPRIAVLAIVRDQFEGRRMAQVISFVMIVFTLVPAVAPLIGSWIIAFSGWRGIFVAFILWAGVIASWIALRQPETLDPAHRRPFRAGPMLRGAREILSLRQVSLTIGVQSLVFGILFGTLSTVQPIFDRSFGQDENFPLWFGLISLIAAGAGFLNARVVVRLGMRHVVRLTLIVELVCASAMVFLVLSQAVEGTAYFVLFLLWLQTVFFFFGLTIGNLNALAMQPLGHLAGLGASVVSAVSTVAGVAIAVPIGLAFDGTPLSLALGCAACCAAGLALMPFVSRDAPPEA